MPPPRSKGSAPVTVRVARKAAGLTIDEAAALAGVTPVTWCRWEGGTSRPSRMPHLAFWGFLLRIGAHPSLHIVHTATGEPGIFPEAVRARERQAEVLAKTGKPLIPPEPPFQPPGTGIPPEMMDALHQLLGDPNEPPAPMTQSQQEIESWAPES